jgi:hypothetical protein
MRRHPIWTLTVTGLLLTACNLPVAQAPDSPQTWIDAPLNNHSLPAAPYLVVFHSASPQGVQAFEFSVDGDVLGQVVPKGQMPSGQGGTLYHSDYEWTPPGPGTYLLEVRPMGPGGDFGPSAVAQVTVVTARAQLPPPTEEPTPEITPTAVPEPIPAPAGFGEPVFSSTQVYWGRSGCGPQELTVEITHGDPSTFSVVLFYRFSSLTSSEKTEWTAVAMAPIGNGSFELAFMPVPDIADGVAYAKAMIQIQVVGTDQSGEEIGRTPVYGDVLIDYCIP